MKNQSGQDPLNFPIKINNRLASLLSIVSRGDGRPIGNAPAIFKDLVAELKVQTDALAKVLATRPGGVQHRKRRDWDWRRSSKIVEASVEVIELRTCDCLSALPAPCAAGDGSAPRRRIAISQLAAAGISKIRSSSTGMMSHEDCSSS